MRRINYFYMQLTVGNYTDITNLIDSIMILISGAIAWEDREVDAADNERSMGSVEPSTWPYLAVPSVVARGNQGVNEMATLARIFNAKPDLIAYSSPLIPLCLFLALRFLIVTRNFPGGRQSLKDVSPLRRALSALRTIFPVAGISPSFRS